MPKKPIKIKVWGDDAHDILKIICKIRSLYTPNVTQSDLINSSPRGYHAFLTIYPEEN